MKLDGVVFVYRSQDWQVARILAVTRGKVEVELTSGERVTFSEKRLAHVSERSVPTLAALCAYEEEVTELKRSVDVAELWAMLDEEMPQGVHDAADLAALGLPNAGTASVDAMAWALFDDPIYFKRERDGRVIAASGERVAERLRHLEAELRERRLIDEGAHWLKDPTTEPPPDRDAVVEALQQLVLFADASPTAAIARRVLKKAFPRDSEADVWIAWRVLVDMGVWSPDENLPLLRSGLPTRFSDAARAAADEAATRTVGLDRRVDYRSLVTVAIDDRFTTEVDDALAIVERRDGLRDVYVFIADASEWVEEGGAVDRTAYHRVSTLYIPEGKVPMLPASLSDSAGSLQEGVDRPAMAFVLTLDDVRIVDFRIEEAIVSVDARLTYEDVDSLLEGVEHAHITPDMAETVEALMTAADELRDERRRGGSITLDRREMSVHIHDGEVHLDPYRTDDPARRLVSEWMIATCAETAEWCRERGIPALYRAQEAPEETPWIPLDRPLAGFELQRILRTLRRATLRAEPAPHAGLGVSCYTQITSPLRRYADLLMHRQLKSVLRSGAPRYSKGALVERFDHLESVASQQRLVERESRRYWSLRRMESLVGSEVEVEVVRQIGRRFLVELVDHGVTALWSANRPPQLGEVLTLRLKTVNARRDRLVVSRQ